LIQVTRNAARSLTAVRSMASQHNPVVEKNCSSITPPYAKLTKNLDLVKRILDNRPLTLAEKVVYSHLTNPEETIPVRGETYLKLSPGKEYTK
jgi:hypothetical protein